MIIGDAHTHEMIAACVPDNITQQQTGVSERFLKYAPPFLIKTIARFLGHRRISDFLKLLKVNSIDGIMNLHIDNMIEAGITYSIILLLDFSWVAEEDYSKDNIQYEHLVEQITGFCAKPEAQFRLFPFFMFDPRREDSLELLKKSYQYHGIVGIKIYPAYGFDPRPDKARKGRFLIFPDDPNEKRKIQSYIGRNLEEMYEFSGKNNLPIVTHCAPGGSWLCGIPKKDLHKYVWEYTQPYNFREIARDYGLRISFAHRGGNIYSKSEEMISTLWYKNILEMIFDAHLWKNKGKFYADISYGLAGLYPRDNISLDKHVKDIKKRLDYKDIGRYFMFGTDWPLHTSYLTLKEYANFYISGNRLSHEQLFKYCSENIAHFLFGENKMIPDNYINIIKKRNAGKIEDKCWIKIKNNKYYLENEKNECRTIAAFKKMLACL